MNHWKIVKSIYDKVVAKCPEGTLRNHMTKTPDMYPVRVFCGNIMQKDGRKSVCTRIVPSTQAKALCSTAAQNIKFVNFNTSVEQFNFWQSHLTKFSQFCFIMDESTKLAPYMGNYTQPWDDKRFYEYFGLTQPEIQLIETVIK